MMDPMEHCKTNTSKPEKILPHTAKANKEADIQRMLFEQFACRRSTASFVPDVLAHAILSRHEFVTIFGNKLTSTAASTKPGVVGTPDKIFKWIAGWTFSEPIKIDVILMEMMDLNEAWMEAGEGRPIFAFIPKDRTHTHTQCLLSF